MDSLETVLGLGFKVYVPTYLFSFKLFSKPVELFAIDSPFDLVKQPRLISIFRKNIFIT